MLPLSMSQALSSKVSNRDNDSFSFIGTNVIQDPDIIFLFVFLRHWKTKSLSQIRVANYLSIKTFMYKFVQIIIKSELDKMIADPNYKGMVKLDVQPRPNPPANKLYIMTMEQMRSLVLKILIRQKQVADGNKTH